MQDLIGIIGNDASWALLERLQDGRDEGPHLLRGYRGEADKRGLGPDFLDACRILDEMRLIGLAALPLPGGNTS
ncbi:hypothetical protein KAR29_05605 [Aminithiophilus ramosus]|uniref:Uncharacterized protein n=2 Tax=Synergistales TaxID=649776 RepID=A0A9Q7AES1_9BACT|nr:hypothetical protein [Aminithiophilus ramosus]QTX33348.1 hypothetical protein KAR29_05605 [Aminithiophilus ramosus]QVL36904.1 hypothetical protein KIH16_03755 [Synergistota bacterium]